MRSRIKTSLSVVLMIGIGLVMGCSIDSSSDVSDQVDSLIDQNQAQAEADAAAAAAAEANSSSSSERSSSSSAAATPTAAPTASPSSSSSGSSSLGGFVWKPVSEGDGNLVVLLPPAFAGKVASCDIIKGGSVVERGRFTGDTNGNRPTFRYSQPGAGYGSSLTLVARLRDGSTRSWSIPSGASRVG